MLRQRTIRHKISCNGVGLHCGEDIRLEILPAAEDSGISFIRTDMRRHAELKACIDHVADTKLATTLAAGVNGSRATVGTVEHLLAALMGVGIDNATVMVSGPEVPILDGSARPFVDLLNAAGIESQRKHKRFLVIKKEVRVSDGDKMACLSPGPGLAIECSVDFDHPLIPPTPYRFEFSERGFRRDLAAARTFGFLRDVEALRAVGLARGGSLDNAVVIDQYRVLNPDGLRYPDEFVRHKVLDAIGDLSLLGLTVIGKLKLQRSGHALNTRLVRQVLSDPKAYEIVVPEREDAQRAVLGDRRRVPLFEPVNSVA